VPPELEFHRFHPTAVAIAVAVMFENAFRFVADICGELAEANVTVARPNTPPLNGPSKADCEVGDCVAKLIHLVAGRVAAAPPVTQSNTAFSNTSVSGILSSH
jgi:hypothetical protein